MEILLQLFPIFAQKTEIDSATISEFGNFLPIISGFRPKMEIFSELFPKTEIFWKITNYFQKLLQFLEILVLFVSFVSAI